MTRLSLTGLAHLACLTSLSCLAPLALGACGDDDAGGSVSAASTGNETGGSTTNTNATPGTAAASTGDEPTAGSASGSASATTTGDTTPTTGVTTEEPTTTPQTSTTGDPTTATTSTDTTDTAVTASSESGDTTTGEMAAGTVRFVAFGDTGEGNEAQYAVGQAMAALCADKGCDFGLLLGDNFYDSGVDGVDDPQWQEKFEMPYEDIDFPIYATLGNHDYGGNGIGVDFDGKKAQYQIDYTKMSQIWKLPAKYHSFKLEHAEFWDLDTNQIMTDPINGDAGPQQAWLANGLAASKATWKIAFGHHPYISNGDHGNAGDYENLEGIPLPFVTGDSVKEFMEDTVCGKVDVYLCGHDHNLQWLAPKCGTEFIVSGAGSKAEGLPGSNPAAFGLPETEGFLWVEIKDNTFTGVFYDQTGKELFTKTIMK
ncbi:MAG TPA: metallophosphoesterase [Nannocystis sp.]